MLKWCPQNKITTLILLASLMLCQFESVDGFPQLSNETIVAVGLSNKVLISQRNGSKWPEATIKYKLNEGFTEEEAMQFQLALDDFSRKTCISFEVENVTEEGNGQMGNHVEMKPIEWKYDVFPCHLSQWCMRGGHQKAWFGQECKKKSSFAHELYHILCLPHVLPPPKYAYIDDGLSKVEAEAINKAYNCKCHRHYWQPIESISEAEKRNMYNFGLVTENGSKLYPCRVMVEGKVVRVGSYTSEGGKCRVFYRTVQEINETVEVLVIPAGFTTRLTMHNGDSYRFQYEIVDSRHFFQEENQGAVPVFAGMTAEKLKNSNMFVALGSFSMPGQGQLGKMDAFGTASINHDTSETHALFAGTNTRFTPTSFKILLCKKSLVNK